MIARMEEELIRLDGLYGRLLELAREKAELLKGRDYEAVGRVTDREQSLMEEAKAAEEQRMRYVRALGRTWGVAGEELTAAAILTRLEGAEKERMRKAVEALSQTIASLKEQNEKNAKLLEFKLRITSFVLEASRTDGNGPGNPYGMDGSEIDEGNVRARFIDSEV